MQHKIKEYFLSNPNTTIIAASRATSLNKRECGEVYHELVNTGAMPAREAGKETREAITATLKANASMTYNQAANANGMSNMQIAKRTYDALIADGVIQPRGYAHFTEERKTRVNVDESIEKRVRKGFLKYPKLSIAQVAKKIKVSHGACYPIHDRLVVEGVIETRRHCRTSTVSEPPLYVRKANLLKVFLANPTLSIPAIAEISDSCYMICLRFHDELVAEGKLTSHRQMATVYNQKAVIKLFKSKEYIDYTLTELAEYFSIPKTLMYNLHNYLVDQGKIECRKEVL